MKMEFATPSRRTPKARATGTKRRAAVRKKKKTTATARPSKTLRKPAKAPVRRKAPGKTAKKKTV